MAKTITIPDGLEKLGDSIAMLVGDVARDIKIAQLGRMPIYRDVEDHFADLAAEIERESHRAMLQALDVDAPRVLIEGVAHRRVLREESTYHTMAGDVTVMRSLYRECGSRAGKTVDAVSLHAGVVADGWLPRTAQAMSHLLQQGTSREAETTAKRMKRMAYSRSSFERVGHLTGELYVRRHAEIEDELIRGFEVPEEAHSVSISIDRVSVPMEEPRKRPPGRPRKNAPKNPVERNYRMAWAGTVTFHDRQGEALHTNRYGRMPDGDPVDLVGGLLGDVMVALAQRPELQLMALADGAHEIWKIFDETISEHMSGQHFHSLVDLWHVIEKLGSAARVMYGDEGTGEAVARWKSMLLNSKIAAARILVELKDSGKENVPRGESRPVHEAITYLTNHANRMDYASARKAGLPVGSGNVEATCKSLFEIRMKRPGSRWKNRSGSHIVQLRALCLSDRWDQAMHLTLSPLKKSVKPLRKAA